jgi:hypothetical protein
MPTLFDEVGILLNAHDDIYFVRETDRGFKLLCDFFRLNERIGSNWYARAEAGEILHIELLE